MVKQNEMKCDYIDKLLLMIFIISPFLDILTGISRNILGWNISFATIVRGLLLMLFPLMALKVLLDRKRDLLQVMIKILMVVFSYYLLFLLSRDGSYKFKDYLVEINALVRYLFFPIIFFSILIIKSVCTINEREIRRRIQLSTFIYALMLVIPFGMGIGSDSYTLSGLKGSVGFFYGANEISLILGFGLLLNLTDLGNQYEMRRIYVSSLIILIALLITGTKTGLLFVVIFLTCCLFKIYDSIDFKEKNKFFLIISFLTVIVVMKSSAFKNFLYVMSLDENKNFIRTLFSGRLTFLEMTIDTYKRMPIKQKILGVGTLVPNNKGTLVHDKLIEMDPFDIIFRYGVFTFFLVISPLYYYFKSLQHNREEKPTPISNVQFFVLILMMFLSVVMGHVLSAPSVSIYLAIYYAVITKDNFGEEYSWDIE